MAEHGGGGGPPASSTALRRLATEFAKLSSSGGLPGIVARPASPGNLMLWRFALAGPAGSAYACGVFTGSLAFPADYPLSPPRMRFEPPITHPNVYAAAPRAGEVCISILHAGADATGYERAEERWSPVHSVQSVLLSVQSMLHDVNVESPANVDAAKLFSREPAAFRARVRAEVLRSLELTAADADALAAAAGAGAGADAPAGGAGAAAARMQG